MNEAKIIKAEDGTFSIEIMSENGEPIITAAGSMDEVMTQLEDAFGEAPAEMPAEGEEQTPAEEVPEEEQELDFESPSAGKKLEDNLEVDEDVRGMNPKRKASLKDYGL